METVTPPVVARRGCLIAKVLTLTLIASSLFAQSQTVPEYNAKAGYLSTFTNYATWPADAFASAASPTVLCVLGQDPFGDVLDKTAAASRGNRPLHVRRIRTPNAAAGCQLVFIAKAESRNEAEWLAALKNKPVLTVGESGQTVARGGAVEFATVRDKIVFDVNLMGTEPSGVKLSSDLLSHARKVYR